MGLFDKIFGTHSDRELKKIQPIVDKVNALSDSYKALCGSELRAMTPKLKERLANGETLDDILPDAFATVREATTRVLGLRHYDVQILGGIVLHQGRIAEMKTGEGKTLMSTLPAYLNALTGNGVHIVTVNDYLARRDSEWMGKIYRYLGMSVGLVVHGVRGADKQAAYAADITYGTNNEYGFDYLRDNMVIHKHEMTQRGHAFAIIDEVDSILVDEARTPLIISGQGDKSTDMYEKADKLVRTMRAIKFLEVDAKEEQEDIDADYIIDEKARSTTITTKGQEKAERYFGIESLSDPENSAIFHHINQALKAHGIMKLDVDYVNRDGEIVIVDESTGRLMFGRRFSEGLHQAIEAKERVKVQRESRTLATITFQNYFRLYGKLSGMTGTALTEENEFREIYSLDVVEIPTNKPMQRQDYSDVVYKTQAGKYRAIIENIEACFAKEQPVLVGTVSIEKSELLSAMLKRKGIPHNVLNAKLHEQEAHIVAQAGKRGVVTISTNMAGRGTDISLGGNAEFAAKTEMRKLGMSEEDIEASTTYHETDDAAILEARRVFGELEQKYKGLFAPEAEFVKSVGGLFILGTERHESRRIDNQLRGRAGRQGDPGETRFYISLEDDLMRLFGGDRLTNIMGSLGLDEDTPIEAKILSNTIESSQQKVENRNFDVRKHVLQYDDVMNLQRKVIYEQRRKVLDGENLRDAVMKMITDVIDEKIAMHLVGDDKANWNLQGLINEFKGYFLRGDELTTEMTKDDIDNFLKERSVKVYEAKEAEYGEIMRELERVVMLSQVDKKWTEHIDAMDELRKGIGLRSIGQRNPVLEYKFEGFDMFEAMSQSIKEDTVKALFAARLRPNTEVKRQRIASEEELNAVGGGDAKKEPVKRASDKVGRNDICPCGSGKKYKKCCGA